MHWIRMMVFASLVIGSACAQSREARESRAAEESMLVLIGTSGAKGNGIYASDLDVAKGTLSEPRLAVAAKHPGFLAIHPTQKFVYATSEINEFDGKKTGGVGAFALDPKSGTLVKLNEKGSGGMGPCHVSMDRTGAYVFVANYSSGSVAVLPVKDDGTLGDATAKVQHHGSSVNPKRQEGPHAHSFNPDPANQFALAADLGWDRVLIYPLNADDGTLDAKNASFAALAPGAGPRHLAFSPSGEFVYVINELSNTVTAFAWDGASGRMSEVQTISTLPEGYSETSYCAEVVVHPNGKFLYGSNRGHDSIAVFEIGPKGKLESRGQTSTGGKWPRNFAIEPTGKLLIVANQNSDDLVVFRIDQSTGELTSTGSKISVEGPTCVRFVQR